MNIETQRPTVAEIDLSALRANFDKLRKLENGELMAVVKADAYGHGAVIVARTLAAEGCGHFGVATQSAPTPPSTRARATGTIPWP